MANFDLFSDFEKQINEIHDFDDDIAEMVQDGSETPYVSTPVPETRRKKRKTTKVIDFNEFINDSDDEETASSSNACEEQPTIITTRTRAQQREHLVTQAIVTATRGKRGRGRGGRPTNGRLRNSHIVDCVDLCSPSLDPNDSIVIQDDDDHELSANISFESENYEISVKVYWALKLHKLLMRRFQKFDSIIKKLGELEKVNPDSIVLTLEDNILSPSDTPESIDYKTSQFIYGRTMEASTNLLDQIKTSKRDPNSIEIKIQSAIMKKPILVQISKTQNMKIAIIRCAEELNENAKNLQLRFDGEIVDLNETPDDLELEGGEVFDVIINKS